MSARAGLPRRWFLALGLLLLAASVVAGALELTGVIGGSTGGPCPSPRGGCLRVLFIGDSYTAVNDLPGRFASAAAAGGHRVETAMDAPGGATLGDHSRSPATATILDAGGWDVIVLQDQSSLPINPAYRAQQMGPAVANLAARAGGARVLLMSTWAHRDGFPDAGLGGYVAGQEAIDTAYESLSAAQGLRLAPVGEAWAAAVMSLSAIELWQADGSHPSEAGSTLAAFVLYAAIFGAASDPIGPQRGVATGDAQALAGVAWRTVLTDPSRWHLP